MGLQGAIYLATRAKAVQAIFRLLTPDSLKKVYSESGVFVDVSADDWHSAFVNTLQKSGWWQDAETAYSSLNGILWGEMVTLFTRFTMPSRTSHFPSALVSRCGERGGFLGVDGIPQRLQPGC